MRERDELLLGLEEDAVLEDMLRAVLVNDVARLCKGAECISVGKCEDV